MREEFGMHEPKWRWGDFVPYAIFLAIALLVTGLAFAADECSGMICISPWFLVIPLWIWFATTTLSYALFQKKLGPVLGSLLALISGSVFWLAVTALVAEFFY